MKRPLILFAIALIIGILAAQASNSYFFIASSVLLFVSIIIVLPRKVTYMVYILSGTVMFYSIGAFECLYVNGLNEARFKEFIGEQVIIRGYVDSEPDIRESRVAYVVKTMEVISRGNAKEVKGKVLLTTLKGEGEYIYEYGSEIRISGQLNAPKGKRNPGGFDYKNYLAQSGVSAVIFARDSNIVPEQGRRDSILVRTGLMLRGRIINVIDKSLPEQQAGLLNGMLIGYRKGLSKEVQDVFSDSGLTHIMAVSGANVAFIVFPLAFILKKLRLKQKTSNIIMICVLILFVYITGFEPSVVRAVIMAITILAGHILRRETDVFTSISFAAILMLLFNPHTLFNIGFQLSFAATLSLVLFYKNIKNMIKFKFIPDFIADVLSATISAQAGVLPVTVFYFNKISLISIVSNLIVVPVLEVITILGSLMAVFGQINILFSRVIGYVNCTLLSLVLFTAKTTASVPFAVVRIVTPSILLIVFYYIFICFFLWYKPASKLQIKPVYYIISLSVFIVVFWVQVLLPRGLEVVFIDVGEGDSIFIRTYTGRTVLIDGGGHNGKTGSETNIGDTTVIPFLLDYGVSKLDLVVATHGHDDHIQGLIPVLGDFKVASFAMPGYSGQKDEFKQLLAIAAARNIDVNMLHKGDLVKLDERSCLTVLNPQTESFIDKPSLNNTSLVLKLHYMDVRVLLTGDIESEVEHLLVEAREDIGADVLKVAHHGSETSTTEEFLELVDPEAAVISVGKNNFGHPSSDVLKRLTNNGIQVFRTDEHGAVILKTDGRKIWFKKTIQTAHF